MIARRMNFRRVSAHRITFQRMSFLKMIDRGLFVWGIHIY